MDGYIVPATAHKHNATPTGEMFGCCEDAIVEDFA
jgi:hypothetical protein